MAACALASARVRDGAIYSDSWDLATLREPSSEVFYEASKNAIPDELSIARGLDYLRAYALLALVDIQYGQIRAMHHHLGLYHSLVAMDGLHDEANWPENLGIVETEERRRLVSYLNSLYTLCVVVRPGLTVYLSVLVHLHLGGVFFCGLERNYLLPRGSVCCAISDRGG